MNTYVKLLAILLLFAGMSMPAALADDSGDVDDISFESIKIDDVWYDLNGNPVFSRGPFYAGEKVHVKVNWESLLAEDESMSVTLKVELGDDLEEETEEFTVRYEWTDTESFVFSLPRDMDPGFHNLHLEFEDEHGNRNTYSGEIQLEVSNQKHYVEIYDVNFRHGLSVDAGETLFVSVGAKNVGHEMEEDIKISISIPELGLYQKSNRFDLCTEEYVDGQDEECCDDDDEYKIYKDLYLTIPSDTVSGVYDLIVSLDYDDDDEIEEEVYSIVVGRGASPTDTVISIDKTSQTFAQGSGVAYTVMFPTDSGYSVKVEGIGDWGTYRVDGNEGQAYIFVSADESAATGSYPFTVKVMAGSAVVKEFDLTANVTKFAPGTSTDIKEGLQIGFAILLVILIILGIILAAKKIGKSNDYEESLMDEGETYY
jgi:hypothetical protein